MMIIVTREDIENGRRCDPDCCPIGRALSRSGVEHLGVLGAGVRLVDEQHYTQMVALPLAVKDWILAFDGKRPVEPISFELAVPSKRKERPKAARTTRHTSPAVFQGVPALR